MYINEFIYDWIFTICEMELRQLLKKAARKLRKKYLQLVKVFKFLEKN